jgi:hypothetical protein
MFDIKNHFRVVFLLAGWPERIYFPAVTGSRVFSKVILLIFAALQA